MDFFFCTHVHVIMLQDIRVNKVEIILTLGQTSCICYLYFFLVL